MATDSVSYTLRGLLPGKAGTEQSLAEMANIVRRDSKDPAVVALARSIVKDVAPHDEPGEVKAVYEYVKRAIRYVQDPFDTEWIQDTRRSLELGAGDCDDKTTALASLLAAIGYNVRFVVCGYDSDPLAQYDHVWLQAVVDGRWTDLDASEDEYVGWKTNSFAKQGVYPIFDEGTVMAGLGQDYGIFDDYSYTDYDPFADYGYNSGDTITDPLFDYSTDPTFDPNYVGDSSSTFDPNYDPADAVYYSDQNDIALFDYLQQRYGYTGTNIDDQSLVDIGVFMNQDGSYAQLDGNGNLSFHSPTGSIIPIIDSSTNQQANAAGLDANAIKQISAQVARQVSSGGGSGASIPLGSSGSKPQTPSTGNQTVNDISKTIQSLTSAVSGVLRQLGLNTSPYGTTRINPLTGQPISSALATQGQGISMTTVLLIGLAILVLKK